MRREEGGRSDALRGQNRSPGGFFSQKKKFKHSVFQGRLANRAEQVESSEGQTTFTPRLHSENRPNMFFCLFFFIIHVCISTVYVFFIVILQDSLMASAERNRKQKKKRGGKKREVCPILHTVETSGGRGEEGRSAWICP